MMGRRRRSSIRNAAGHALNQRGFTLIELVVVMGIFIVVMMMMSKSFENIIRRSAQQGRSVKTQIEGVVGLEMLRTDVSHAGYALPWAYTFPPVPGWVEVAGNPAGAPAGIDATDYNDTTPRAVRGGKADNDSHYLVLKSGMLADTSSSLGRFNFVNYSSGNHSYISRIGDAKSDVRANTDRVISLLSEFSKTGLQTRRLLMPDAATFSYAVPNNYAAGDDPAYMPADASQNVYVYAISDSALRMPYNRADYYIFRTPANDANFPMPSSCNSGTGILFKAVAGHDGNYTRYPLLNCVGDLQVSLGLDPANDGNMSYNPPFAPGVTGISDEDFRAQLKEVRIYLLAHEGGRDPNYQYPGDSIWVGEPGYGGREWTAGGANKMGDTFGSDWRQYRWKVYSFVVQMKNLQ